VKVVESGFKKMTCYFRHLKIVFKKAGIEVMPENRKTIDGVIRSVVGLDRSNCPQIWREVKKRISEDEARFVSDLADAWRETKMPRG
jgi:hypothetical protein